MSPSFRKAIWALSIIGLIAAAAIVVQIANRKSDDNVRIGALLALTGSGANYGKSLQQGIELAKEEVNNTGGINGKPLQIIYEDSQGDAKTGVAAFTKLVSVDHVPAVLGSISSVILAVAPIADQQQVVLLNSSAISPKICDQATNFLFSVMVSGAEEAKFMASSFARLHPATPIAILYSNNASGIDTKNVLQEDLRAAGVPVPASEGYELNATDFRTQLAKIKASGARYGYLIAFSSAEFARVLRQSKDIGLYLQWFSYSGLETKETLDLAADAAEGVIYSYPAYSSETNAVEKFQVLYKSKYGSWADIYTVTSYDAVKLLSSVLKQYGQSSVQIRDGLRMQTNYEGLFGKMSFGAKQCVTSRLMWKTVKNSLYVALPEFPQ
jgi:branched-chain amino acid transport system substrate-binding protein